MTIIEKVTDVLMKYDCDMSLIEAKIIAKAAIEAMRDIDDDILDAGAYDLNMTLRMQWTNIIDAALKED